MSYQRVACSDGAGAFREGSRVWLALATSISPTENSPRCGTDSCTTGGGETEITSVLFARCTGVGGSVGWTMAGVEMITGCGGASVRTVVSRAGVGAVAGVSTRRTTATWVPADLASPPAETIAAYTLR